MCARKAKRLPTNLPSRLRRKKANKISELLGNAIAYHQLGQLQEAESLYQSILQQQPKNPDALHLLGVIAYQVGKYELAENLINQSIAINPSFAEAHNILGNALIKLERYEEALKCYELTLKLKPDYAEAYISIGNYYKEREQQAESIAQYKKALSLNPDCVEAHNNLGVMLLEEKQYEEAIKHFKKAISLKSNYAEAYYNLGNTLKEQGKLNDAIENYHHALAIIPNYSDAYCNLGNALLENEQFNDAISNYRHALAIRPDYAEAHNNLGVIYQKQGLFDNAIRCFEKTLSINPNYAEAHNNLGNVFTDLGQFDNAVTNYNRALEINPGYNEAQSNLFLTLNYLPSTSNATLFDQAKTWASSLKEQTSNNLFDNTVDPKRQLKIAYVSADFHNHPVGYFMTRVLSSHNDKKFEVICYSNSTKSDDTTMKIKKSVNHWYDIIGLSDTDVASLIRNDCIDILVDLSGHTANNRLSLFAKRPAPIQVSWLGYFATTGLKNIDYIVADRIVVPEHEKNLYTEKVIHLPDSYLCFDPPTFDLPINTTPSKKTGVITFGCFNNRHKLSKDTISLWAEIMNAVPGSRLLLKYKQFSNPDVKHFILESFSHYGIENNRIIMEGKSPRKELLENYQRIDIALDPFPFGGGTTTAECLWMGVPLISMKGDRWVGRVSESILNTVGVPELVADDKEAYRSLAITLSNDIPRLEKIRKTLREKMENSALCDGKQFTKNLENEYQNMWQSWCDEIDNQGFQKEALPTLREERCPACSYNIAVPFLDGKEQPLATLAWPKSSEEAKQLSQLPLDFVSCVDCGHVFNAAFEYSHVPYSEKPNLMFNKASNWSEYLNKTRTSILEKLPEHPTVVEIGYGDGSFLAGLAKENPEGRYIGFDPNGACNDNTKIELRAELFQPEVHLTELQPDIVISRHVLEHLINPLGFLQRLSFSASMLKQNPLAYFEVPCIDHVFESGRTVDFYYEHSSQFTTQSFTRMLKSCGVETLDIGHGYGGEVVYAFTSLGGSSISTDTAKKAQDFCNNAEKSLSIIKNQLSQFHQDEKSVAIWGGTGKSAAFMCRYEVDAERFPIVVDSDKDKVGTFVPGTGQDIRYRDWLLDNPVDVLIIPPQWRASDILREMDKANISAGQVLIEHSGKLIDFYNDEHIY